MRRHPPKNWDTLAPATKPVVRTQKIKPEPTGAYRRHDPNGDSREIVHNMTAFGFTIEQIEMITGMPRASLYKHYGTEIKTAVVAKDLAVFNSAFLQAVGGPDKDWEKARFSATKSWLEARGLWKPPTQTFEQIKPDLSRLSNDELTEYRRILQASDPRGSGSVIEGDRDRGAEAEDRRDEGAEQPER